MNRFFLFNHIGSGNHGCEALVRTVGALVENYNREIILFSEHVEEDKKYDVSSNISILPALTNVNKYSGDFLSAYIKLKVLHNYSYLDALPYRRAFDLLDCGDIGISIGGDVYCYEDYPKYILIHKMIKERGCKTVLLGCSLEEKLFHDPAFLEDMKRYNYISAREQLTYNLLRRAGLTNIGYAPDSAFLLPCEEVSLPEGFLEDNTIGINVSPLVAKKEARKDAVVENYKRLVEWILEKTDCSVALIPHVVWESNDDRIILQELYDCYSNTNRVVMIPDCNAMQLKGFISRCRFFVGARTHATIAAYSTCVPTLVVGYSIKSRGIATDLFGTDDGYVIPVQNMRTVESLSSAFQELYENEIKIRKQLEMIIPNYTSKISGLSVKLEELLGEQDK